MARHQPLNGNINISDISDVSDMTSRKTENVTRVDIRIPKELYEQISEIAVSHFRAKIHHRSQKPEVTPTILELIKIGIVHLESTLPVTQDAIAETVTDKLQQQIAQLDSRLATVENKLSGLNTTAHIAESKSSRTVREQPTEYDSHEDEVLTDMELSNVLNVSNLLIRDYRVYGKKPRGSFLAKALTEHWEIKGEGWVKKNDIGELDSTTQI